MFGGKSDYDRGVNTFSPEGRLLQVEYALEAIKLGTSAVGLKVKEGVVLAVERIVLSNSNLMCPQSSEKISEIDFHVGCAASGLVTDARVLVDHARVEAQNHYFVYNEGMRVKAIGQTVSDLALNFGEGDSSQKKKPMSRPYGVALLIAGVDDTGPQLFQTDPSGTMVQYDAKGIGAADEGIHAILKAQYNMEHSLEQAKKLALSCLKQVMEEKINSSNVELCVCKTADKKFTRLSEEDITGILATL